jgi:hypothetical protein
MGREHVGQCHRRRAARVERGRLRNGVSQDHPTATHALDMPNSTVGDGTGTSPPRWTKGEREWWPWKLSTRKEAQVHPDRIWPRLTSAYEAIHLKCHERVRFSVRGMCREEEVVTLREAPRRMVGGTLGSRLA